MTSWATIRIAAAAALTLGHAGFAAPPTAGGLTVRAVKFWSLGTSTRIAIEVSDEFQYRKDRLDNPNRMFVDIVGAQARIEGAVQRGQHTIAVNDKFVKQIRIAEPKAGITRVVLDLEPGVECTTSQLTEPDRMMIEVTAPGRPETPIVTPSVVVIKRFEPPPPSMVSKAAPLPQIKMMEEEPPQIAAQPLPSGAGLPSGKKRRLLASAAAPDPIVAATKPSVLPAPPPVPEGAPLPAKRNSAGDRSMTRVFGLKIKRIVIDAGHGGKDEGTRGPTGLLEKELVLDVAKRVGALVQERLGVEVIYTRTDDTFIPLEQRTVIANDQMGDLLISIHANASTIKSVSGVEIYYLSFSNSKVDLETAARENAGAESSVHELQTLLQKAMLNDKLKESSEFASKVLQAMAPPPPPVTSGAAAAKVRSRGVRRAPFIVLIGAKMPSILAEIGFISNPADEALMAKPAHRQKIAESLARGIQDFAQSLSRYQVATEPARTAARATAGQ
jgi:N-acetylmuramoyl-L-alanine amidase